MRVNEFGSSRSFRLATVCSLQSVNLHGVAGGTRRPSKFIRRRREAGVCSSAQSNVKQRGGPMNFPGANGNSEGDARRAGEVSPRRWMSHAEGM